MYKNDLINLKINQFIQSSTIEPPDVLQEQAKKKEWESVTLFVNTFSDLRYFTLLWKVHYRWIENVFGFIFIGIVVWKHGLTFQSKNIRLNIISISTFQAFVFFATHFMDLGHLENLYPNVQK